MEEKDDELEKKKKDEMESTKTDMKINNEGKINLQD